MRKLIESFFGRNQDEVDSKARKADEKIKQVNDSYSAFLSAAGDTLSLAHDVTVGLRDRIDDYTNQIEATSQVIPDALILVSSDGVLENVNSAAEEIFGYTKQELLGKNLCVLFTDTKTPITLDTIKRVFKKSRTTAELVRKGLLSIHGVKKNNIQFFPNIKISEFSRSDGSTKFMLLVQDITDAVLAEQRFLTVFYQQTAIIKALPDVLIMVDYDLKIIQVFNSSVHDSFIDELHVNENLANILSADNLLLFRTYCETISEENPLDSWNFQIENNNGSISYYEARASLCGDKILIVMRDETDVVITREELLESEKHFRAFGLASNEAMMIHNSNGILDWNPRLGEMTGFSGNEISGMRAEDFIHPMERNRLANSDNSPNKAYTTLFRTKKGDSIEVAITEREIDWKNGKARIKVIRDITHLKDVDQLLHLSRERYKTITDNTFDVVACYGVDLKLSFVNQTFLDYFGKPVAPDTSLLEAIDARDHQRVINHLTEIGPMNPVKRTLHRVRYNGETRWLDWIDRAVFDDNGNFVEFQGIGRDVTDYIRKAKELQK